MTHLFEVPYNFDEKLLIYYGKHRNRISFLYLPPYKDDLINTRTSIQTTRKGHCYTPQFRSEYEYHLKLIRDMELPFVVLWQSPSNIISNLQLDYYASLGCSGFTIANDTNAEIIKNYDSSLTVICSIVQKIRTEILYRDFSKYDYIILYFCYNRALDAIKLLSQFKEKIILMPNTLCHIDCPSTHHWFPSKDQPFNPRKDCWIKKSTLDRSGLIFPEHLNLFNQFVGGYKLQGREYPTEAIKYLCHFYFQEEHFEEFISPFLEPDMAKDLYDKAHNVPLKDYYNLYTHQLINSL